jgi:hypothetical protein
MNEIGVFPDPTCIKGLCQDSKLAVVDMGDAEIYGTPLEMQTVTYHALPGSPQIFVIRMRSVS